MKKQIINVIKIVVPLGIGLYLAWYFFNQIEDKQKVYSVFSEANYLIIFISVVLSWLSHYTRALRFKLLSIPMGYQIKKWHSYHAVMIGYFMNLLLPRAGELSRAAYLSRYENMPFEKAFGTILAERVIDILMLLSICLLVGLAQYDKLPVLIDKFSEVKANDQPQQGVSWFIYILILIAAVAIIFLILYLKSIKVREKINNLIKGFFTGITTIFKIKQKILFVTYTLIIWFCYISMYVICFYAVEQTANLPLAGIMLGFIAGSMGIIFVQGGIGVYPVLVATALALYDADKDIVFAVAWITWLAQTLLIVTAGAISMYFIPSKTINPHAK